MRLTIKFLKENQLLSLLIFLSFISALRILLLPLSGDELTYSEIAKNIITQGEYARYNKPSTITPSIPFIIAFFYTGFNTGFGFVLVKLFNLSLVIVGLRYLFLYLQKLNLGREIVWSILLLVIVNNNFVRWGLAIYPEPILFCFFWMFIYYVQKKMQRPKEIIYIMIPFVILVLTRYVFAVLGLILCYHLYKYVKNQLKLRDYSSIKKLLFFLFLSLTPLLFWFKYVYSLEKEVDTGLSYFSRFKDNGFLYNIKAGIGIIQHEEVSRINGIPAFISLFVPITGIRSWFISLLLIFSFCGGYILYFKNHRMKILFFAISLVLLGLVFAGTGFSRYWLPMLPGFLLGFYLFFSSLKLNDSHFILLAKLIAITYVLNELRLDVKVLGPIL